MTWRKKNWLVKLIRNGLRILCLFIFIHWFTWITTYANCTNYRDSINKSIEQKTSHNEEIEYSYQKFGKREKKKIEEIEEDILSKIEVKKNISNLPREWKTNQFPELEKLYKEKEEFRKKQTPTEEEKKELVKKEKDYEDKLKKAKEKTIKNIHQQLENNGLTISELDDGRNWWESLKKDPLNFFFISPINKFSKKLGLEKYLWAEIIFKLIIVKLIYFLVTYPEATLAVFQANAEKLQNPSLSVEEKEQINQEISPLTKYLLFNGMMFLLFNALITFFHPSFLDRTNPQFYQQISSLFLWILLLVISGIFSSIGQEISRQGRIMNINEIKAYLVKHWIVSFIVAPLLLILISLFLKGVYGSYLFAFLSGLVEFIFNMIKIVLSRKKETKQKFKNESGPIRFKSGTGFIRKY